MVNVDEAMKGIFLLILAVAGNFVAETLGCKTQKLFINVGISIDLEDIIATSYCCTRLLDYTKEGYYGKRTVCVYSSNRSNGY